MTTTPRGPVEDLGDPPLMFWLHWPARDGQPEAYAEYIEGDLRVWEFPDEASAGAFRAGMETDA